MRIVALYAIQAKILLYARSIIRVGMGRDGEHLRHAGAIVACIAKGVVLSRRIEDKSALARVYAMAGRASIGYIVIAAVRTAVRQGRARRGKCKENGGR